MLLIDHRCHACGVESSVLKRRILINFTSPLQIDLYLIKYISHVVSVLFSLLPLSNDSMTFHTSKACLLQLLHASWWLTGAVDFLHAPCDTHASSIIDLLCSPSSEQLIPLPHPSTPFSASTTLTSPNHKCKVTAEMHVESIRGLTSRISESRLKWMQQLHKPRLVSPCCPYDRRGRRADVDNAVTNCFFLFSSPLISPLSFHSTAAHYHASTCTHNLSAIQFPIPSEWKAHL